ncbi:MAG TPA: hypothetical protein VMT85_12365 [Thermoanaerobaculia bacterium]|nr:hypothetical protein [Thermoanaerobaculia bacterium]
MTALRRAKSAPGRAEPPLERAAASGPEGSASRWLAAALFAVTVVLFAPVRDHGAIPFDDPSYVTQNEQVVAGLTIGGVRWAFTTVHAYNWHPLTWIAHMLDVELFGDDLGLHHLSSVVLHAASAALLLLLLASATRAPWRSCVVALLFAVHPLRVESVAWLSERKDTLSAFLFLLCLALWVARGHAASHRRRLFYAAALAVYTLGLSPNRCWSPCRWCSCSSICGRCSAALGRGGRPTPLPRARRGARRLGAAARGAEPSRRARTSPRALFRAHRDGAASCSRRRRSSRWR